VSTYHPAYNFHRELAARGVGSSSKLGEQRRWDMGSKVPPLHAGGVWEKNVGFVYYFRVSVREAAGFWGSEDGDIITEIL